MKAPPLVAHRGYQRKYPENTLIAFEQAIAAGAKYIETDVQLSADHVPVLYHDDDLARISQQAGAIHDYTAAELAGFRASEPARFDRQFRNTRIATLDELATLVSAHPEVTAFIEIKTKTIQFHGMETVYRHVTRCLQPIESQCLIISFFVPFIVWCREQGWPNLGVVFNSWAQRDDPDIIELAPECIFCGVDNIPSAGSIALPDTQLVIYEVDQPGLALSLLERGADLIETFDIGGMVEALREKQ